MPTIFVTKHPLLDFYQQINKKETVRVLYEILNTRKF